MIIFESIAGNFEVTCIKDVVDRLNEMNDGCQDDISLDDCVIKYHWLNVEQRTYCYEVSIPNNEKCQGGILGYVDKLIPYTTTPRYKP